ncbi:hypothetical protein LTR36_004810 [Oleoguttula mirabilis]|uniref:EF-hand domain-containing protein n=1 Tax=Oleoguttula mirabilis TaxID=1507867 RepID=A0AAV9JF69_9PEZI|nr:hypothetical protein LTR36_004810 [Oleoguttula mirabilis]
MSILQSCLLHQQTIFFQVPQPADPANGIFSATLAAPRINNGPLSHPRPENALNPQYAVNTAVNRVFGDLDVVKCIVDQLVTAYSPLDLNDLADLQDFENLPLGAGLGTEACRHAYSRRWQVNIFTETCSAGTWPSFTTSPAQAVRMFEVRFIFELNLSRGGDASNDWDMSWGDCNDIDARFPNLKTATFVLQFDRNFDHIVEFCDEDPENRVSMERFIAFLVDRVRADYGGLDERLVAVEDFTSAGLEVGLDMRSIASDVVAVHLLEHLGDMVYV